MEVQKMKHICKFCKKSFPCGRSLGGHIRSHLPKPGYELRENPKKTWRVANDQEDTLNFNSTNFSSSSTETENPKPSKMDPNQGKGSNFGRNNSHSSVSEVVEAEHHQQEEVVVAMCLIMLSKDVGSWGKISSSFTTFTESSENNLLHKGKKNKSKRRRREKIQGNVSVSVAGNGKKFESSACGYLQKGVKLKGIEVSANGFCSNDGKIKSFESKRKREKVVQSKESDFTDDHAVKSAKVESVASGYGKNGVKINEFDDLGNGFISNEQNNQTPESKRKFIGQSSACGNVKKWSKLEEFEVSENGFSSYDQKNNDNNKNSGSNNNNDHNELDSELCKTRSKFECTTCNKVFHSYQALGGHRASHKKLMGGGKCSPMTLPKLEAEIDTDVVVVVDHEYAEVEEQAQAQAQTQQKQEMVANNMVIIGSSSSKKVAQKHQCPICYRVFSSGQALGGHKRSHLLVASSSTTNINDNAGITTDRSSEVKIDDSQNRGIVERLSSSETRDLLDLNFPPAQDEVATTVSSSNSLVGFMKPYWCVESSHKHEQLLGLISN